MLVLDILQEQQISHFNNELRFLGTQEYYSLSENDNYNSGVFWGLSVRVCVQFEKIRLYAICFVRFAIMTDTEGKVQI